MTSSRVSDIKRSQKESLYYRIISSLLLDLIRDNPSLATLFVNRVELSANKGSIFVFLGSIDEETFKQQLKTLKLFKPSMRKALGDQIKARYVPDIVFKFDKKLEKQREVEALIDSIQDDIER